MNEKPLVNRVRSTSTRVPLRALNQVRSHHFVIDSAHGPDEEITPIDAFLSGISSCAVHQMEMFAEQQGVKLEQAVATIEAFRRPEDPTFFDRVDLHLELFGPDQEQAEQLVEAFKGR
ncbi:MAG TPA: OsmC family protein [Chloroflexota bacterium]|nr:OsmC family protein [Chloroflexota bacterium]